MSATTKAVTLPGSLAANPLLAQWLRFEPGGAVEVSPGKVEIGQGILTVLTQIVVDELDVAPARVRLKAASTAASPNEGVTSGSLSVQHCGIALRHACAEARALFLTAAADKLGVAADALTIEDGIIVGPDNARTSYWELTDQVSLDVPATGEVMPKPTSTRRHTGNSLARVDIPDKVFGRPRYIHDLKLPQMLHGRVLRPQARAASLVALDEEAARASPGFAAIVRDGNFVGVLAETEEAVERCLALLRSRAEWRGGEELPDEATLTDWLKSQPVESKTVDSRRAPSAGSPASRVNRRYSRPFLAHGSIAPSCALAQWANGGVHVWTHSQGIYNLRTDLATVFKLPPEEVVVEHAEGAGCYGHNGADDVALDAALLARAADGRPVRVQWTREDELARAPFGAAMAVEIEAELDEEGEVLRWRHELWSNGHTARPGRGSTPALLAASELAEPFPRVVSTDPPLPAGGSHRNAIPIYDFPAQDIVSHRLLVMPVRVSALRSLGAFANVFAIESFMDELAAERGEDPVAFRLRHLRDPRARAVLEAAAARAGRDSRRRDEGTGYGVALARYKNMGAYCAVAAEVEGEEDIHVRRLVLAVDVGEVINPDGVKNQIEGGAIQATSWTLKEAVRFDRTRITSDNWENYPILKFSEVPAVEVEIVPRPEAPPVGAGEAAQGPVAGAIANAVFDALGVRVRHLPITRDNIIAAMELS
ncbi:xanthine dehydrogenase family protein molybdopterin-binding subunit [Chelativorans salis]|uniref:Molybdopterin-dependent oxidoreductase n=1 Tax=Chelativorans salis TaxID=2978478 RepID=A0ABT2LI93_9HYPH|nr:molybdopterin cofactor-binding domain-containing protein [Chelativorans sp. EGI FJ00035]MCT7374213.1 molybdopterin-dependent oxidoreductase [Chelativorans sp. EGI FJ00035]